MSSITKMHAMQAEVSWVAAYFSINTSPWFLSIQVPRTVAQGLVNLESKIVEARDEYFNRSHYIRLR